MECPRCGEALTAYTLADTQAVVCESCEYVGVAADHRPQAREEGESWGEALDRFRGDGAGGVQVESDDDGNGGRDCGTDDSGDGSRDGDGGSNDDGDGNGDTAGNEE